MTIDKKKIEETMTYYWFLKDERNDERFDRLIEAFSTLFFNGLLSVEDYQVITEIHDLLAEKF